MCTTKRGVGAAATGTAGTGKVETIKDLGKALGQRTVVVSGEGTIDIKAMAKLFKGLAYTGSWCIVDELNLLRIDVMAVVSGQLVTLFNALQQQDDAVNFSALGHLKKGAAERPTFEFDGAPIPMVPTCWVAFTVRVPFSDTQFCRVLCTTVHIRWELIARLWSLAVQSPRVRPHADPGGPARAVAAHSHEATELSTNYRGDAVL